MPQAGEALLNSEDSSDSIVNRAIAFNAGAIKVRSWCRCGGMMTSSSLSLMAEGIQLKIYAYIFTDWI